MNGATSQALDYRLAPIQHAAISEALSEIRRIGKERLFTLAPRVSGLLQPKSESQLLVQLQGIRELATMGRDLSIANRLNVTASAYVDLLELIEKADALIVDWVDHVGAQHDIEF